MIETVVSAGLPVGENLVIRKKRIEGGEKKGASAGRISIVTGIHGDELEGQYVCYELARRLEEHLECLCGMVDIYPALNPLGIDTRHRAIPQFEMDMNRIFPGSSDGTMMERTVAMVIEDLIGSDVCIDVHSSNSCNREVTQVRISQDFAEKLLPFAKLLNTEMIWLNATETVHESTLAHSMNMLGVPTLVVEMGLGSRINMEYGNRIVDGILNLMREMGLWSGAVGQIGTPAVVLDSAIQFIRAQKEGIFLPAVTHESWVKKGELLGRIVDVLHTCVQEEITAPCDGLVFTLREYPVVYEGALLIRILRRQNEE